MKKAIALSILLTVASTTVVAVSPSLSQTVSIVSGTISIPRGTSGSALITTSTLLTSIGAVTINSDGLNGTVTNTNTGNSGANFSLKVSESSVKLTSLQYSQNGNSLTFVGTTNGTSSNGSFTNAPTTINSSGNSVIKNNSGSPTRFVFTITSGNIAFNTLRVSSDLVIANSVLNGNFSNPLKDDGRNVNSDDFRNTSLVSRFADFPNN